MALSINAEHGAEQQQRDENPGTPLGKRHSGLISPSCRRRGPLSDVNSNRDGAAQQSAIAVSKPPTPAAAGRASLGRPRSSTLNRLHAGNNQYRPPRPQPSKEEIQATDEKQASVDQLSSWLANESAKKKKPIPRPNAAATPPISFRAKPRIKREEVEATDDRRVSVKKLSTWMSNDPFEQKKVRTIRSGAKVIARSRAFEKDTASVAKCDIKAGSVGERQAWLSGAFQHEKEEVPKVVAHEAKVRPYQVKKKEEPVKELKSVRDKKEWLSKAFKTGGEGGVGGGAPSIQSATSFEAKPSAGAGASIQQATSFDANCKVVVYPSIGKSASADCGATNNRAIHQTKSCDDMAGASPSVEQQPAPERQQSVVRLYRGDSNESIPSPTNELKSVHDKQAWLSNAFRKTGGSAAVEGKKTAPKTEADTASNGLVEEQAVESSTGPLDADEPEEKEKDMDSKDANMSVADRAKWLRAAFK